LIVDDCASIVSYRSESVWIIDPPDQNASPSEIIGVGRLVKSPLQNQAEVAAVVSDVFHRKGIGRALVHRLVAFAKDEKLGLLKASVLTVNQAMQKLLESEGFLFHEGEVPEILEGELRL
jgi:RimJ/RimL family protein N-acetyltransferase